MHLKSTMDDAMDEETPATSSRARLRIPFTSRFLGSAVSKSVAARWESADAWIILDPGRCCWDFRTKVSKNWGFSPWLFHHYGIVHAICIGKMRMDHVIGGPVFRQSHHLQSSRSSIWWNHTLSAHRFKSRNCNRSFIRSPPASEGL